MRLSEPLAVGAHRAPNRVMFGPHVTNLGDDERRFTARHTAYYERRARGGSGIIVTEGASVHGSDWPYERAPLAERCGPGWASIVSACRPHGALVVASLDHSGGQGSSAYSQAPLLAPSRVPEVNTREIPKWMEADDIAMIVSGFAAAAKVATEAGCDGVEINGGQHSLVRQFLSGLTNQRGDEWGGDRLRFARDVIAAVRPTTGLLGLRLSCDELAPWAGITPEMAPAIAAELVDAGLDYVVVVRGAIFSIDKTRADFHEPTGYNIELCRTVRAALADTPVFLQGSIVDAGQAEWAIADGVCDGVEMTRAQLADPDLVSKVAAGRADDVRPCIRCNQTCQVRDARNPIVSCVLEPTTGRETEDPDWYAPARDPKHVVVVGGGVAGLETARVAVLRGHQVTVLERRGTLGGIAAVAGPGAAFVEWLTQQCNASGVELRTGVSVDLDDHTAHVPGGEHYVQCTGSIEGRRTYTVTDDAVVLDIAAVRYGDAALPDGPIVLHDPIGGPIAVALAEQLGERAVLITPDNIAGNELSRSGDLAPANVRLQQRGVQIERRAILRAVRPDEVEVEDRFSGQRRTIAAAALVDCGFRLPTPPLDAASASAGDCVAPRTLLEAVLEARRAALSL